MREKDKLSAVGQNLYYFYHFYYESISLRRIVCKVSKVATALRYTRCTKSIFYERKRERQKERGIIRATGRDRDVQRS